MKNVLILMLLCGCSLSKQQPKAPVTTETSKDVPEWVYSPYEFCTEAVELCATGEGKGFKDADAQAKINLASIFQVEVKSSFSSHSSVAQNSSWTSKERQEVQRSLKESVSQVMQAVQIKQRFKKDGLSYSLASIDRRKSAELLGERLAHLDNELQTLWQTKQRTNLRKMLKLHLEREKLNEKFSIVNGTPKPSPVAFAEIMAWKESRPKAEPLALRIAQVPDWLENKVQELFTEAGFKIVKTADKVVSMNIDSIREHLNVDGFEKYTFTLTLSSIEDGKKKNVISTSETVTGRSQADALLKVKKFFSNYLEDNLAALQLD